MHESQSVLISSISLDNFQQTVEKAVEKVISSHFKLDNIPKPIPDLQHDLIGRKEAAKLLGVSLVTLNEWDKTGTVPAYRIGTRVRYKKSDLENCLKKIETS